MTAGLPPANARARAEQERQVRAARDTAVTGFLTRSGNADLLPILGLVDEPDEPGPRAGVCLRCGEPLPTNRTVPGYCTRRECRAAGRAAANEGRRRLCPTCKSPLPDPISNGGNKPCRRRTCRAAT